MPCGRRLLLRVVDHYGHVPGGGASPFVLRNVTSQRGTQTVIHTPPESSDPGEASSKDIRKLPPLRSILTRPVLITIASYAMLAFFEMSSLALIPLVWSTPIEFGGLNLSPLSIGLWTSAFGCISGILQFVVFPRAVRRFGLRPVFVAGVATCAVLFAMFPLENLVLRHSVGGRQNATAWLLILLQLGSLSINKMGFGKRHLRTLEPTALKRKHAVYQARCICTSVRPPRRTCGRWAR